MSGNQYRCVVSGSLNSNAATLTVNPLPIVTLNLPFDTLYMNSPVQTLTGGTPSGGVFSGTGISVGVFNPGAMAPGNYTATYRYTDANGCSASASDGFTIIPKVDRINLYPNPAKSGQVTIIVSPELAGGKATAYNDAGQKVAEWVVGGRYTTHQFKWPAGHYSIVLRKGSVMVVERFIIGR
jgi:hypothetical protein